MKEFTTGAGRLVQGHVFNGKTTNRKGEPLKNRKGEPRTDYFFAIAIRKDDPSAQQLINMIEGVAKEAFPNMFGADGRCTIPKFSFKYVDGDSTLPNGEGKKPCDTEGFPGCYVFKFATCLRAPSVYNKGFTQLITDPNGIKKGDYIQVNGTVKGNSTPSDPGVYLNPDGVQFLAYGEAITSVADFDPAKAFSAPVTLPPGASETPLAAEAPTAAAGAASPPPPDPNFTEIPPPPAAPDENRIIDVGGQPYAYSTLKKAGWSDVQIAKYDVPS